jgi:tripartite-type tricarboxylate transporter receptor subunit TctC
MRYLIAFLFICISLAVQSRELNIILSSDSDGHTVNARIFAKYLAKNIPPNTSPIFRVVPGAAGLNSTNYLYNIAPKDGNTIGIVFKNIPIIGAIGGQNIQFDAREFLWLGSVADGRKDVVVLVSNKQYTGQELIVGAESVVAADPINFIERYSNLNIRRVSGYKSSNSVRLAYERGEIDAFVSSLQGIKTNNIGWLKTQLFLLQMGNGKIRHADLLNTPTMNEIVNDEEGLKILSLFETQFTLLRSFVAPPGIPENKKQILLSAFNKAVKDPDYIKDAARINLEIDPIYHEEAQRIVNLTYSTPKHLLDRIK